MNKSSSPGFLKAFQSFSSMPAGFCSFLIAHSFSNVEVWDLGSAIHGWEGFRVKKFWFNKRKCDKLCVFATGGGDSRGWSAQRRQATRWLDSIKIVGDVRNKKHPNTQESRQTSDYRSSLLNLHINLICLIHVETVLVHSLNQVTEWLIDEC